MRGIIGRERERSGEVEMRGAGSGRGGDERERITEVVFTEAHQLCAYLNVPTVMPAYSALITNINTIQLRAPMAARGRRERKGERERKRERERERERE